MSTFGAKLIIMRKYALLYLIVIAFATNAFAQDDFTIGHFQNLRDADIYFKGVNTAIRPATGVENEVYDSLIFPENDKVDKNWFVRKLFHEHLFIIGNEKYKVYFDPIFDFRYNRLNDLSDPNNPVIINGYTNTRGAIAHAKLSEYVYLNTSIYETQAVLPAYMAEVYRIKGNIPGHARVKKLNGFSQRLRKYFVPSHQMPQLHPRLRLPFHRRRPAFDDTFRLRSTYAIHKDKLQVRKMGIRKPRYAPNAVQYDAKC